MNQRKTIEVVAAVICDGERVFATQRGYGEWKDWWEFPGGKMEPGETPEAALMREIREELRAYHHLRQYGYQELYQGCGSCRETASRHLECVV